MDLILDLLDEAAGAEADANRAHARSRTALAEVMRLARANPHLYLRPAGLAQKDVLALAEDAAAFDAGLRLHLTAGQIRVRAHQAQALQDHLPRLGAVFAAGGTTLAHVVTALELVAGWMDDAAVGVFDTRVAEIAGTLTPAQFRARTRRLKEQLLTEPAETRHTRAFEDRRVVVEPADDGMAWLHAFVSAPDAVRIIARLNATARAEQKKTKHDEPGWRSRDQIRADLAVAWLAGDGTPTAATVRPVLLVPLLTLIGQGAEPVQLRGYGTIDAATARSLFTRAPSFRRVGTDPFTGEKLVYDRTRYRPTQAQRDWIAMRFEDCIDPTCSRPVDDADIDHLEEWVRDHGPTNDDNLVPLCETSNRRKNLTRYQYERHDDGTVTITTPTGLITTTEPPPF
ncbi:DUF222 domain-containing protein [Glaciibacter sp. 2TAF33]|uniref:HNH endonuclease signature motif containing protein n=1 Tax=Glaciibacter sp. 2TAF33 TaxID=3233015 RepID=UPI003F9067A4